MADMRDLGSRAARRKGSSPFPRTIPCGSSSVVEHRLAKARVAGSSPVFRSIRRGRVRLGFLVLGHSSELCYNSFICNGY